MEQTSVACGTHTCHCPSYVPDDGSPTNQSPPDTYPHDGNGAHYIVTGGGGGPLPGTAVHPVPS